MVKNNLNFYRPQRSCGQGNVFTGVCLSTGGEGVCLSACWDATPPDQADPPPGPGRSPQTRQTPPDQADPPRTRQTPPGKQTPAYGLRVAGTHPTGMHSCYEVKMSHLRPEQSNEFNHHWIHSTPLLTGGKSNEMKCQSRIRQTH